MAKMRDKPDWGLPIIQDQYTGPYWSDGKIQSSVVGKTEPYSKLDACSQAHDASYAIYSDRESRREADKVFHDCADAIGSTIPGIAGDVVYYGNRAGDAVSDFIGDINPLSRGRFKHPVEAGSNKIYSNIAVAAPTSVPSMSRAPTSRRIIPHNPTGVTYEKLPNVVENVINKNNKVSTLKPEYSEYKLIETDKPRGRRSAKIKNKKKKRKWLLPKIKELLSRKRK